MPAGIGEPVFDKLDACLAKAIMSIGAVKAVEIGEGTEVSESRGSYNNDGFTMKDGKVSKSTNHAGGILGGMSDGSEHRAEGSFQTYSVNCLHTKYRQQIRGRHRGCP